MIRKDLGLDILNGPRLGGLEGIFVGKCDGEVLGRLYGVFVGRLAKGFCWFHQAGPGQGNVWVGCFGALGGRQGDRRCQNQGCWLIRTDTPAVKDKVCY